MDDRMAQVVILLDYCNGGDMPQTKARPATPKKYGKSKTATVHRRFVESVVLTALSTELRWTVVVFDLPFISSRGRWSGFCV